MYGNSQREKYTIAQGRIMLNGNVNHYSKYYLLSCLQIIGFDNFGHRLMSAVSSKFTEDGLS